MYHHVLHSEIPNNAHRLYLCILYGSQNKQRLYPCATLTNSFLQPTRNVFTARCELSFLIIILITLGLERVNGLTFQTVKVTSVVPYGIECNAKMFIISVKM